MLYRERGTASSPKPYSIWKQSNPVAGQNANHRSIFGTIVLGRRLPTASLTPGCSGA